MYEVQNELWASNVYLWCPVETTRNSSSDWPIIKKIYDFTFCEEENLFTEKEKGKNKQASVGFIHRILEFCKFGFFFF